MNYEINKFGGASVNSASAVKNMADIVEHYSHKPVVIVVSAMGKTTNNLELLVPRGGVLPSDWKETLAKVRDYLLAVQRAIIEDERFRSLIVYYDVDPQ